MAAYYNEIDADQHTEITMRYFTYVDYGYMTEELIEETENYDQAVRTAQLHAYAIGDGKPAKVEVLTFAEGDHGEVNTEYMPPIGGSVPSTEG